LEARHIPFFAAYLSFTGGPLLREIEERFHAPIAIPFYCSVDPELYRPTAGIAAFYCDMSYLGTYAQDRQAKLERLLNATAAALPKSRFIVAGPQYPPNHPWEMNVERIIHLSPREHPAFYCSSRFTLNLTRAEMITAGYSPSVRLFEAAACGATILSDAWDGLESFLTPGEEILLPRDTDDVVRILRSLSDAERIRIGLNARERILSQHTAMHRALQFEGVVDLCRRRIPAREHSAPGTLLRGRQDARHKQIRTRELSLPQQ
jgi:spore maturation protein CgeB